MMKILVTGGGGYIGSHVVKMLLNEGHLVSVIDNFSHGYRESVDSRAKLVVGDIADPIKVKKALENIDTVIHMADLIVVPESVQDPVKYCNNNVLGAVSFLNSMQKSGVKNIIFSSSACVYGTPDKLPIEENAPLKPDNPYGAAKASTEAFLQSFNVCYGFNVTVLRYFNPYGPGKFYPPITHAIPNFIMSALAKTPIPLYWKGEQIRDFIYIDDLVRAHIDVLGQKGFNIYNIGTEKGVKVKDVVKTIFKILGYEVAINDLGKRPGDVFANYASSKRLEKAVGWKAKVGFEEGLRKTIDYYKNQNGT